MNLILLIDFNLSPGLVEALVDGACDRETQAREAVFKSLTDIGRRKFSIVLEITHGYLTKHNKVFTCIITQRRYIMVVCALLVIAGSSTSHHSTDIDGKDL